MKSKVITFLLVLFFASAKSQHIVSSNTYIQTCVDKAQCSAINNSSYLFYDEADNMLYLKVDFNDFKSGHDSIYDWLEDLAHTNLYFKAPIAKEEFYGLKNHEHKVVKLNGRVLFNGIWHNQTVSVSLFSSEGSLVSRNNNGNMYDNYKMNFTLSVLPRNFKIHKMPHHLRKVITIGLVLGRINLLQPGNDQILGEAYREKLQ